MPDRVLRLDAARRGVLLAAAVACLVILAIAAQAPILRAVLAAVVCLAAFRPVALALFTIAFAPIARPAVGTLTGYTGAAPELLVLATIAGCLIHRGVVPGEPSNGRVRAAAVVLGAVAAASLVVELAAVRAAVTPDVFWPGLANGLVGYADGARYNPAGDYAPLPAALILIEGVLFFLCIVTLPGDRVWGTQALRMFVAGAAAAGAINILRFLGAALRNESPLQAARDLLRWVRISVAYGDVNAAGSFFVLGLLASLGFAAAERGAARLLYLVASGMCAGALWLSGSRAALIAGLVVLLIWLLWRGGRYARMTVPGVAAAALLTIWVFPNPVFSGTALSALGIRVELARTSFRLLGDAPVFGIGIGRFYARSAEQIRDPEVRAIYPRENAHNNFLQILAELGIAGLLAFSAALALALAGVRGDARVPLHSAGAVAAVCAFLLTCLAGHPLLTPEVSIAYWSVLGALAKAHPGPSNGAARVVLLVSVAALLVTLPWRIQRETGPVSISHAVSDRWSTP
jgi:O-antigen ligase